LHILKFIGDKLNNFLIVFYIYLIFLFFVLILLLIMAFRLKKGKYNIIWPIEILKYVLPIISSTFYGQIFALLISAFKCPTGRIYYNSSVSCTIGTWFYVIFPFGVIAIIIQVIISYITISMYYQADFISEGNDILKKRTSIPDIIFLLNKMTIIITFGFDKEKEYEHWPILFCICIVTGVNAYGTLFIQSYENIIIRKFNYFYSLFLFWGFICVTIGKIFKSWKFDGAIYLFVLGIILIIIYCLFYSRTYFEFLHLNFNDLTSSEKCLNYIREYLKIIKEKETSRENSMMITSFIEKMEINCKNEDCILKKYLISLSKGFDSHFLLLKFAQNLFRNALNKFPKDITLRIHYVMFLLTKVNQKKHALKELLSINQGFILLDDNFKLFRCKKYLEEYNPTISKDQEIFDNNDIIQSMEYKNNLAEFRKLLSKSSYLYYDFWSSLYSSHLQGTEDFKKLNDIGAELNELIDNIENIFKKLREIKNNDINVIKLYELFAKDILNDKEKYEKYNNISSNLIIDSNIMNKDIDYTNYDVNLLSGRDEYKFLIISAEDDKKGTITNMSLNACLIFGYHRNELIGKNVTLLIPEIYHKTHEKIFNELAEKTKTEFFECLSKNVVYTPKILEVSMCGRNKSKYLIPIDFKAFFVQTEESELVFILKFISRAIYNNDNNEENENLKNQCCVLTDKNFIIQTFTPNCVEALGLNSKIINSNYDITSFIKQFNDDLQTIITNTNKEFSVYDISEIKSKDDSLKDVNSSSHLNDKSFEHKLKLKRKLMKLKYSHRRKIVWNIGRDNQNINLQSELGKTQTSLFAPQASKFRSSLDLGKKKNFQKNFYMEVKQIKMSGKHLGYYFYFTKYKLANELNNFDKSKGVIGSPITKSNLRRPSVKFFNLEEESVKSSRIYNEVELKTLLHRNSFEVMNNEPTKKSSYVKFDLDNIKVESPKKKNSANNLNTLLDEIDNVDDKYIPSCNFNFFLDLESMTFKPSTKLNSNQECINTLRRQSIEILNALYNAKKKAKKKDSSSYSSSSFSEESSKDGIDNSNDSYSNLNISSSSSSSSKSNSSDNNNKKLFKRRTTQRKAGIIEKSVLSHKSVNINNNIGKNSSTHQLQIYIEKEYYKVNLNRIKFMIYDFNQEMVINSSKIEKKSQLETIIEKYKLKNKINISEDSEFQNISFEKFKDSKNKNYKNENSISKKTIIKKNISEHQNNLSKEKEFEKEISFALKKQDEQKTIIFFYVISFIALTFFLLMSFLEIYFIIHQYKILKENFKLILSSTNLKYFTNSAIYYIRENTLFTIENNITNGTYNLPHSDSEVYKYKIVNTTKNIFLEINSMLESIIGTNMAFCENAKYVLTEKPFEIKIIHKNGDEEIVKNMTTTLHVSMITVYSSLINLLTSTEYISIENPNLFNFIHNSFNNFADILNLQLELYVDELSVREKHIIIEIVVYSVIYLIFHIIIYLLICHSYFSIIKRKDSYISVFYGIGLSLIKSSIKKCELFINQINEDDDIAKVKDYDEEASSIISSYNFNSNNKINNNNFDRKSFVYKKIKPVRKNRQIGEDKKSKNFKILYTIFIITSFLYLIIVFFSFLIISKEFIYCASYIYHMQNYHNNILELFNSFREYLFDDSHVILGLPSYEYLLKKEKLIYISSTDDINYLTILNRYIKGLYPKYLNLQEKGFCSSYICYFNSQDECKNYIGGEDGILSLGFHLLINSFLEEVRNARNLMTLFLDEKIIVGNLSESLKITDNDKTFGIDVNKTLIFRMQVFNLEQIHKRLNIIFLNIILQYINQERDITIDSTKESLTNVYMPYVILIIVYIVICFFIFCVYWIPMIQTRNIEIYKTKNMLSIIPVKILATQPNIRELLNISTKID